MVNWENYEEYMMLEVDGELDDSGRKALQAFLVAYPELQDEFRALQATVSLPDADLSYPDKAGLLRPAGGHTIWLGSWKTYAAAAGLIGILLTIALQWQRNPDGETGNMPAVTKVITQPARPAVERSAALPSDRTAELQAPVAQAQRPVGESGVHSSPIDPELVRLSEKRTLAPAAPVAPELLAEADIQPPVLKAREQEPVPVRVEAPRHKSGLLAWLPLTEEKKEGVQSLKESFDTGLDQARTIGRSLRNTELALRVGEKEVFVINL